MSGTTLRLGAARMVSRFSVARSARATFSVPPVLAAAVAGAVVGAGALVGLAAGWAGAVVAAGALVGGAGAVVGAPQAESMAMLPPDTISRKALRRLIPLFTRD